MANRLNIALIISKGLILVCAFIISCNGDNRNNEHKKSNFIQKSPLDTILGDKILNNETKEMRNGNLKGLLKIKKDELKIESALYNLRQVDNYHFVLNQKKNYANARNFSILIKTDDVYVTDYIVFNDFFVDDIKRDATNWILLLSDFYQANEHWKSEQQIKIVKLDAKLNEVWIFLKNSSLPLSGQFVYINPDNYSFKINVIKGCHICYTVAELILTKDGQFSSVHAIGKENSDELTDEELEKIFIGK